MSELGDYSVDELLPQWGAGMSEAEIDWNRLSLLYSQECKHIEPGRKKGYHLVPLFLDELLRECCSPEVRAAFARAIRRLTGCTHD